MLSQGQTISDPADQPGSIRGSQVLSTLWVGRIWILSATLLFIIPCAIYAFVATPVFRATVVLSPASSEAGAGNAAGVIGQLGGLASLAGISLGAKDSSTEEALAVLRSRVLLQEFIRDHDLLQRLFPHRWLTAQMRRFLFDSTPLSFAKGSKYINEKVLSISREKKTGLVFLTIDWNDPAEAASWANELVSRVNAEMQAREMQSSTASVGFLESELSKAQLVETRQAINRLIEDQIKRKMIASVTKEYAFRTVDKALPPDPDDRLSPKIPLVIIGGMLTGFSFACVFFLLYAAKRGRFDRASGDSE